MKLVLYRNEMMIVQRACLRDGRLGYIFFNCISNVQFLVNVWKSKRRVLAVAKEVLSTCGAYHMFAIVQLRIFIFSLEQ
jgi:hypothetical protein